MIRCVKCGLKYRILLDEKQAGNMPFLKQRIALSEVYCPNCGSRSD